jgi:hypothetical protein
VGAGDTIFLTAPDGQELEVAVPEGVAEVRSCDGPRRHVYAGRSSCFFAVENHAAVHGEVRKPPHAHSR